ncbi:MAG: hypothetical protein QM808_16425 [Steroidobacteraceae bacterium]
MRDYFLSDAEAGKTSAGWSSFELWKTTIHEPDQIGKVRVDRPFWQIMDEEEDRLELRHRQAVRLLTVLAGLALSGGLVLLLL